MLQPDPSDILPSLAYMVAVFCTVGFGLRSIVRSVKEMKR